MSDEKIDSTDRRDDDLTTLCLSLTMNERLLIGGMVEIYLLKKSGQQAQLAIRAPRVVPVIRQTITPGETF